MDGKKKWSAAIATLVVAGVTFCVQIGFLSQEQASIINPYVIPGIEMGVGIIYMIIQFFHDQKKEEVKLEQARSMRFASDRSSALAERISKLEHQVSASPVPPFSIEEFDKKVSAYAAINQASAVTEDIGRFYAARQLGMQTASHDEQDVQMFWVYLEDLGIEAFKSAAGFDMFNPPEILPSVDIGGRTCTPKTVEAYAMYSSLYGLYNDVMSISRMKSNLLAVTSQDNWYQRIRPSNLYDAGASAIDLLRGHAIGSSSKYNNR